jgi:hypothetical protein
MRDLLVAGSEHPGLNICRRFTLKQRIAGRPRQGWRGGLDNILDGVKEEIGNASVFKSLMKCSGRSANSGADCKK